MLTSYPIFSVYDCPECNTTFFQLYNGVLCSEKDYIELRNLSFKSNIFELAALAEFNFAPFGGPNDRLWTPYIFGGLAVFYFNPMASYVRADGRTAWTELQPLHTEGQGSQAYSGRQPYRLVQVSLPFGVGVKVRLSKVFTVAAQYGFRKTWTDYLDDGAVGAARQCRRRCPRGAAGRP